MPDIKHITEFGFNATNQYNFILQQEDLFQVDNSGLDPHIYLVTRRPRLTLDTESIVITHERIKGNFKIQVKDQFKTVPFDTLNLLETPNVRLECNYPYTEYKFYDLMDKIVSEGKVALLLPFLDREFIKYLDLEVLYVGQSYGKEGDRNAGTRLKSHSTLQNIYSEAIRNSPDQDIWLILSTFEDFLLMKIDGKSNISETMITKDNTHINNTFEGEVNGQQKINIIEATMIRYFQPKYNKIYKDSFPNPAHKTYSECYDLDFNSVVLTIDTELLGVKLWSDSVSPKHIHNIFYHLHFREDRVYMFEFAEKGMELLKASQKE